jgi:aminoglycoside phosphotransferase (APT) family kinase protein
MGVPSRRDLEATRGSLRDWLARRLTGASEVRLGPIGKPAGAGFTNETLFLDASWSEGGRPRERAYVIRISPSDFNLIYRAPDFFEPQYRLMTALDQSGQVRVPAVHWYEPDPSVIGAPFFLMDRVPGEVQQDIPPYWQRGWLHDSAKDEQTQTWWSAVDALAAVNMLDWKAAGLDFLRDGTPGFDSRMAYYGEALEWASEGEPNPIAEAARDWLSANRPVEPEPVALSWGDARLGNIVYRGGRAVSLLDWEMASLGPPMQDLGWWFMVERALLGDAHTGDPRDPCSLPGFPSKEETVAHWGRVTGLRCDDYLYYEVFAGFRFAVHLHKLGNLFKGVGVVGPDSKWATNNIATQAVAPLIGAEHPPPEPMPALPT